MEQFIFFVGLLKLIYYCCCYYYYLIFFKVISTPNMGLDLTTPRSRIAFSSN